MAPPPCQRRGKHVLLAVLYALLMGAFVAVPVVVRTRFRQQTAPSAEARSSEWQVPAPGKQAARVDVAGMGDLGGVLEALGKLDDRGDGDALRRPLLGRWSDPVAAALQAAVVAPGTPASSRRAALRTLADRGADALRVETLQSLVRTARFDPDSRLLAALLLGDRLPPDQYLLQVRGWQASAAAQQGPRPPDDWALSVDQLAASIEAPTPELSSAATLSPHDVERVSASGTWAGVELLALRAECLLRRPSPTVYAGTTASIGRLLTEAAGADLTPRQRIAIDRLTAFARRLAEREQGTAPFPDAPPGADAR